jgi:hypothetical protein
MVKWPEARVSERVRYRVDGRVFGRNAIRDVAALLAALLIGMSMFEIMLVYLLDALVRGGERALRVRLAQGRARGVIASPMFFHSDSARAIDHDDPRALSLRVLGLSSMTTLLCGAALLGVVHAQWGSGGVDPLRTLLFSLAYTVPFFVHEQWRWLSEKRAMAVPHVLARDLSFLLLFASVMAAVVGGALGGVIAFVVLRALGDAVELLPSYSLDGVSWSLDWRPEWDRETDDR